MTGGTPPKRGLNQPDPDRLEYERAQAASAWRHAESCTSPAEMVPWLERAHRFAPNDQNLAFALATARLSAGDRQAALELFEHIAARHPVREVLSGIAVCALALGKLETARDAVARALATSVPDATITRLADRVAPGAWCGLTLKGEVLGANHSATVLHLDATRLDPGARTLPRHWRTATHLEAHQEGAALLGSPIDIGTLCRIEGFVERSKGGVRGWAWHPGDPQADPVLTILQAGTTSTILAADLSVRFRGTTPLTRPRGFALQADLRRPLRVLGLDGKDVWGSPIGGTTQPPAAPQAHPGPGTVIVVPVYRGLDTTLACLRSVLATIGPADRLVVVNDSSPDKALTATLEAWRREGRMEVIPSCPGDANRNLGFAAAANAGIAGSGGADLVLLNSDTIVHPGWLATLRQAVHSAADIGTATPLSNDATIFTYPDPANPSPMPTAGEGQALAAQALRANAGVLVEVPTGHGFCLYIRAECLAQTGLFRAALFAQGYGEENDFCERAARSGWRHVAVPAVFVGHVGGVSFGESKHQLLARNAAILDRLHPAYRGRVQDFIAADVLMPARKRLDTARFLARADAPAVLLVTHAGLGGTARVVRERATALAAAGSRPILLRGLDGITTVADQADDTPNLRFHLPEEGDDLLALLRGSSPVRAEIHHLSGHGTGLPALLETLAIQFDIWVHDYNWLCARMALVTGEGRFCGEPPVSACEACVARWGDAQEVPLSPRDLRARSAVLLPRAERVVTPSADVSRRIRRHFPAARITEVAWEPDPPARPSSTPPPGQGPRIVAAVGAIGMEKGYDVLLACARDAAARDLKLRFAIAGYTIDDTPLLQTGRVFVTGPFKPEDAGTTIAGLGACIAFLPSIWPETWCFALTDIWRAGLDAAVFDIGTPAERVRRTGRGWVLPLGLPPARVNDVLLNLQGTASRS